MNDVDRITDSDVPIAPSNKPPKFTSLAEVRKDLEFISVGAHQQLDELKSIETTKDAFEKTISDRTENNRPIPTGIMEYYKYAHYDEFKKFREEKKQE
jgi:hypothetical protein